MIHAVKIRKLGVRYLAVKDHDDEGNTWAARRRCLAATSNISNGGTFAVP